MARPVSNPPNPWDSTHVEWLGERPDARLEVFEERAKSALSRNDSPDIPFTFSVNPYRGCQHACAYCYARPTHEYLGFGAGTDFEKKLIVKTNIDECLRRELARPSWTGEPIHFSGVTDCYQPLEASYGLTRKCLEACRDAANPVAIITKSALVRRDADVLAELARDAGARVFLSIPFADARAARALEPGAPTPEARFGAIRALAAAGIECGVAIAPLIPSVNDSDIPEILARARDAGARTAFLTLLTLPRSTETVFAERLEEALPDRRGHVFSALRDMRRDSSLDPPVRRRMRGSGPRWEAIERLFRVHCRRLGFDEDVEELRPILPRRARTARATGRRGDPRQGELFT